MHRPRFTASIDRLRASRGSTTIPYGINSVGRTTVYHFRQLWIAPLALILLTLLSIPTARPAAAQDRQCFPQTGYCVEGRFLQYWRENGGLPVFGYPIGPARDERNRDTGQIYLTQWFERNRFELHPENGRPYDVLLGRLGDDTLLKLGRDWRREHKPLPKLDCEEIVTAGRTFVLCEPFRTYYHTHGLEFDGNRGFSNAESLALFGLPLTQATMETNASGDRVVTQWFERARFEHHTANPEPYKVLLGLLGSELGAGASQPAPTAPTVTYAAQDGGVYEIRAGGQVARIGTATNMGKVLDGVRRGDQVTLLREQGLQRLTVGGSATTIATFSRGNAQFGSLIAPADTTTILYNYNRRNDANFSGFTGIVGVIEGTTARKVFENENQMLVLGVSLDERSVYVVDWGGDPAIWRVRVVSLEDGRDVGAISTENGYAAAALSPSRNMIALGVLRPGYSGDTVAFYEVFNDRKTAGPTSVTLPRPNWTVTQLAWAPDSRVVYALAYPNTDRPQGELWRIDPATRRAEQVAGSLPMDLRVHGVVGTGRFLLAQTASSAVLVDLVNGRTQTYPLPSEAVIAH